MFPKSDKQLSIRQVRSQPGRNFNIDAKLTAERAEQSAVVDRVKSCQISRPTSFVAFLLSAAANMLFMMCSSAVSAEWPQRYADCKRAKFGDVSNCGLSLTSTNRSSIFDTVDKFYISR